MRKQPRWYTDEYTFVVVSKFGDRLRQHRNGLGLLQKDVAARAGVSVSYVSTLERGQPHSITGAELTPERDKVIALAKAVGWNVDEALSLCGYNANGTAQTFDIADKARLALLDKDLSPEDAAEIIEEMTIAYSVIMERRRLRAERENTQNDKR